jgi:hypothetical protein
LLIEAVLLLHTLDGVAGLCASVEHRQDDHRHQQATVHASFPIHPTAQSDDTSNFALTVF